MRFLLEISAEQQAAANAGGHPGVHLLSSQELLVTEPGDPVRPGLAQVIGRGKPQQGNVLANPAKDPRRLAVIG